ncbi:hypothetical protein ES702_04861 [subsurface metagenome]
MGDASEKAARINPSYDVKNAIKSLSKADTAIRAGITSSIYIELLQTQHIESMKKPPFDANPFFHCINLPF